MVRSFESYHIDQVLFLKAQPFCPRQLGELVWLISHKNAQAFLQRLPKHRQYHICFEDLVTQPQAVMEDMCRTFRLRFHPDLLKPYEKLDRKMTDGVHKESKPMGDTKFLDYGRINPDIAGRWKGELNDDFLSDQTWELAISFGYHMPGSSSERSALSSRERKSQQQETKEI